MRCKSHVRFGGAAPGNSPGEIRDTTPGVDAYTFCTGLGRWADRQLPDGTVIFVRYRSWAGLRSFESCRGHPFYQRLSAGSTRRPLSRRPVDHRMIDHALINAPHGGDGAVFTGLHQMLERLTQRLR